MAFFHESLSRHKKLTAGVKITPCPNNYPRGGPGKKFKKFFSEKFHSAEIEPTPYLNTMPNTLGFSPKPLNCRHPIRIEHEKTLQLREPIRIEYYRTRVVGQSESSITSPESSRLRWRSLLGSSRLAIAYRNTWGPTPPPPPPTPSDLLTTLLLMEQNGKDSIHLKRQEVVVKRRKRVNIVVEQCSLSQIELKMMN